MAMNRVRSVVGLLGAGFGLLLSGCAVGGRFEGGATPPSGYIDQLALRGFVQGNGQPAIGARVYLMAMGTTGYGSAAHSVLDKGKTGHFDALGAYVLTTAIGSFQLRDAIACPAGTRVYLLAMGGQIGGAAENPAFAVMSPVGNCPDKILPLTTAPNFFVNEVSTVAMAYGLAAYTADASHIGAPATVLALRGVDHGIQTAGNLANLATGQGVTSTSAGNGSVPEATIYALANVLSACSGQGGPGPCSALFANTVQGQTVPATTADAAINIAHNPSQNVAGVYAVAGAGPFAPALAASPDSWMVSVTYSGGGMNSPRGVAIDAMGNVWTANAGNNTVSRFDSQGVAGAANGYAGAGLAGDTTVAIDSAGNAWAANGMANSVSELGKGGEPLSGSTGFQGGGLAAPAGLAFDAAGTLLVANGVAPGSVSRLTSGGQAMMAAGYMGGGLGVNGDVAVDAAGSVWATNVAGNTVSKLSNAGTPVNAAGFSGGGLNQPQGIAFDAAGNAWIVNRGAAALSQFTAAGVPLSAQGYTGGGLSRNRSIALDGAGKVWTAATDKGVVSEFSGTGVPVAAQGFAVKATGAGFWGVAIDGSGDVWMTSPGDNALVQLVGAAAPVSTPLVTQGSLGLFGSRP